MPIVVVTGLPASGKSTRSRQLRDYFIQRGKKVHLISENEAVPKALFGKNQHAGDSQKEKVVRSDLKSDALRHVNQEDLVILDAGNYIKGESSESTDSEETINTYGNHQPKAIGTSSTAPPRQPGPHNARSSAVYPRSRPGLSTPREQQRMRCRRKLIPRQPATSSHWTIPMCRTPARSSMPCVCVTRSHKATTAGTAHWWWRCLRTRSTSRPSTRLCTRGRPPHPT